MRSPVWVFLLGWLVGSFFGLQMVMGMIGGARRQPAA